MKQYIIDAFTDKVFHGNPAAICVLEEWPEEKVMMSMAAENNLSETAFIVKEEEGYHLRWFTPACEVGLCGHATLASGFVLLNFYEKEAESVTFNTLGGKLKVSRKGEWYEMLFPNIPLKRMKVTDDMLEALGSIPVDVLMGEDLDLICVLQDAAEVQGFVPYTDSLKKLPGRMVHITAPGTDGYDCYSRCFGPKIGILEDPVCGSAHCQIAPYWANRLGKNEILAWDASSRGGALQCEIIDKEQLILRGKAVLYAETQIHLSQDAK